MIKTPQEIIKILRSIEKLSVDDGELDIIFEDDTYASSINGFILGSFTRELLELIEKHLLLAKRLTNIKLCVFDLAGTTVKDDGGIVNKYFQEAFSKHGYSFTSDQINQYMGMAKPKAINFLISKNVREVSGYQNSDMLSDIHMNMIQSVTSDIHNTFVQSMKEYYATHKDVTEVDGTSTFFYYLQNRGIKVAIDTGFSKDITDIIIERMGWIQNDLLDAVVSSDEVANGRPYPDMIQEIMRRTSITDSATVAKIGDTPIDLAEGNNANCGVVVGVCQGSHTFNQLKVYDSDLLLPNIISLKDYL